MLHPPHAVLATKERSRTQYPRETIDRIGERSTQNRTDDDTNIEAHGEEQKCPRLILLLHDDLITPILLFKTPPSVRKMAADTNERENPNPRHEIQVPNNPINKTRLRPIHSASARRPQKTAVRNWAAVKLPWSIPAWAEIVASGKDGSKDFS